MRKTLLAVLGTRPEAIKMAPLINRLRQCAEFEIITCATGQHKEMLTQALDVFSIAPEFNLGLMQENQKLGELTSRIVVGVGDVIAKVRPALVLVHGDTTTTLAASLASYYGKAALGHVEAGLRTGDKYAPWPEEMNRKIADDLADQLYAPTDRARDALVQEGKKVDSIVVTGNTVIDALFDVIGGPLRQSDIIIDKQNKFPFVLSDRRIILVTCHRRESYGEGFRSVCASLIWLARERDVEIVFPVHYNPQVRAAFAELSDVRNIHLIQPLDYLDFVFVLSRCYLVLTDSGGIQEEAPSLGK